MTEQHTHTLARTHARTHTRLHIWWLAVSWMASEEDHLLLLFDCSQNGASTSECAHHIEYNSNSSDKAGCRMQDAGTGNETAHALDDVTSHRSDDGVAFNGRSVDHERSRTLWSRECDVISGE